MSSLEKKEQHTPMMDQYLKIKESHKEALLFYRMGDFYELFHDDARAASAALDIALTRRSKKSGDDIPMCGVPAHAVDGYVQTLIRKGFQVAICEQTEDPAEAKKRGRKAIVNREVVRLITPGTLTEDSLLDARRHNFLAALAEIRQELSLGWVDISTGILNVMPLSSQRLSPELARLAPSELLITNAIRERYTHIFDNLAIPTTILSSTSFHSTSGEARLCSTFGVKTLDAFGSFTRAEIAALGALLNYLEITQFGKQPLLQPPKRHIQEQVVQIGMDTRRNLELTQSLGGGRENSLLEVLDRTATSAGSRLLEQRLSSPSCVPQIINNRLSAVDFFLENSVLCESIRANLREVPDLDRALSRLSLDRGGPRDLAAIRNGLIYSHDMARNPLMTDLPRNLKRARQNLGGLDELIDTLRKALVDEPPILTRDGGFVASLFNEELDDVRTLRDNGRSIIAQMQKDYIEQTTIASLKIKHNNVLGYFIETPSTHAETMLAPPLSNTFIHRQTTAKQIRFSTLALSEMENKVMNAGARSLEIEKQIFDTLVHAVLESAAKIRAVAQAIAEIDLAACLAILARDESWCRPSIDNSRRFHIRGGRHPVVECALRRAGGVSFIGNDCDLNSTTDTSIWLLTGPNMAGKSTFLRQNALIAILAQMGSYVPADEARIGIIDQIFSRIGASDDLARGHSTFMVEMVETSAILHQAGDRALVILDEIGRGTATYDGLSIAWATLEHLLVENKCRTLFATHYHELTALAKKHHGIENTTVAIREWNGEMIFLYEVKKGAADQSYGVQVAKLAGLPEAVVARAREILDIFEKQNRDGGGQPHVLIDDLPLFAARPAPQTPRTSSQLEKMLHDIHPDALSPREALDLIYKLKEATTT
ncbi:MAG: DNA mismatch repair protein MutS [Aestuariivita sp.]|nr:DNA mismatch repair protein MutS [Aestuariivita sp.]